MRTHTQKHEEQYIIFIYISSYLYIIYIMYRCISYICPHASVCVLILGIYYAHILLLRIYYYCVYITTA